MKKFENIYEDAALMQKNLLGEADEAEQQKLEERMAEYEELQNIYQQLQNGETLKTAFEEYKKYSSEKAYQFFLRKIRHEGKVEQKHRPLPVWWYAAAAMLLLVIGFSFYLSNFYSPEEMGKNLIQPGTAQAQLTLPDGSIIEVKKEDVSVVVDGVQVKYKEGVLSYQPTITEETDHTAETDVDGNTMDESTVDAEPNVLVIPRGGENTVILVDGTVVHLNAGSKLTYPTRFTQGRRIVLLEGEGYFQVKEDKEHPFVVRTNFGEVMVHGTEFNVNAYNDAKACYATLVRGKVSCSNSSQNTLMLSPGEQGIFSADRLDKRTLDVEECIGWVKGEYVFNNKSLEEIMQTFERWYDVSVYYETPALRKLTYSGNLKRYSTINTFLDALEITGDIYYQINGKNILIYGNE